MTEQPSRKIDDQAALREHFGEPSMTAMAVSKPFLDEHHKRFIRHSPFLCIAGVREMVDGTGEIVREPAFLELGRVGSSLPTAALVVHVTMRFSWPQTLVGLVEHVLG